MTITLLKSTLELVHANQICDFNMAQTSVNGKRLFDMGHITRDKMPQLKGFPRPGSVASYMRPDKSGKVNVADEFLNYLTNQVGRTATPDLVSARTLRGSQSELVATKVAKHALRMLTNFQHKKLLAVYIISKDGFLLDGHHGWAAVRCFETLTNSAIDLDVVRIDCDIHPLIEYARCFTNVVGIQNKEGV